MSNIIRSLRLCLASLVSVALFYEKSQYCKARNNISLYLRELVVLFYEKIQYYKAWDCVSLSTPLKPDLVPNIRKRDKRSSKLITISTSLRQTPTKTEDHGIPDTVSAVATAAAAAAGVRPGQEGARAAEQGGAARKAVVPLRKHVHTRRVFFFIT